MCDVCICVMYVCVCVMCVCVCNVCVCACAMYVYVYIHSRTLIHQGHGQESLVMAGSWFVMSVACFPSVSGLCFSLTKMC